MWISCKMCNSSMRSQQFSPMSYAVLQCSRVVCGTHYARGNVCIAANSTSTKYSHAGCDICAQTEEKINTLTQSWCPKQHSSICRARPVPSNQRELTMSVHISVLMFMAGETIMGENGTGMWTPPAIGVSECHILSEALVVLLHSLKCQLLILGLEVEWA